MTLRSVATAHPAGTLTQLPWIRLVCPECDNDVWVREGTLAWCGRSHGRGSTEMVRVEP
jgi:hypothetical protein